MALSNALRDLIERLETRVKTDKGGPTTAAGTGGSLPARQAPPNQAKPASAELVECRNKVLTQARRLASRTKRSIEDVIAWASGGSLEYAKMSQLGEADLPKLKASLQRLIEAKE